MLQPFEQRGRHFHVMWHMRSDQRPNDEEKRLFNNNNVHFASCSLTSVFALRLGAGAAAADIKIFRHLAAGFVGSQNTKHAQTQMTN